jgi:hypothetical protein
VSTVKGIPARAHWESLSNQLELCARDRSLHAFEQYTHLKTTWIDLS